MASWLTSRLKAAEQLLQQIDQQAAITKEHLEKPDADLGSLLTPEVLRGGQRKEQQHQASSRSETLNLPSHSGTGKGRHSKRSHAPRNNDAAPAPATNKDRDWTELLGSNDLGNNPPQSATRSSSSVGSTDFFSASQRGFHTGGKGYASSHEANEPTPASKLSLGGGGQFSVQASRTRGHSKHVAEVEASPASPEEDENVSRKLEYGEGTADRNPNEQHQMNDSKVTDVTADPGTQDGEFTELELSVPEDKKDADVGVTAVVEDASDATGEGGDAPTSASDVDEKEPVQITGDGDAAPDFAEGTTEAPRPAVVETVQGSDRHSDDEGSGEDSEGSSLSGSEDQSQSGSGSDSDSEYEERDRRRRERRKDAAERRAALEAALEAARVAIRDREELVARLEEEMENLEELLAEWEERQVKEAEELNLNMKEVSEEVEVERQHHAKTRREGLAREAQLEAKNHELAKALAAAERNLEDESARVALARSKVEAREIVQSDLQRKILHLQYRLRPTQPQEVQDAKIEREIAEEHFAELTARLEQYQNKAKQLEEKIFLARDAHYTPSVMELELESRLNQLTDHLIQKQSQVEALSTEKATLHFRLETISNTLRTEKTNAAAQSRASKRSTKASAEWSAYDDDLEYGLNKPYSSKDKNFLTGGTDPDNTILSQTTGSKLARQVDSVFLMGARVLRTSGSARALSAFYIFLLHSWVLFIFFMHVRSGGKRGAQAAVNELDFLPHNSVNSTGFNP